jgi:glucose-1-phosphate thymidylyltransferase
MRMQVILPVAGLGTRLRPQTWSRPKPLVTVAGKTLIDHVLDRLSVLDPERVVFITGYLGDQIEDYIREHYEFDAVRAAWAVPRDSPGA